MGIQENEGKSLAKYPNTSIIAENWTRIMQTSEESCLSLNLDKLKF